VIPYLPFQKMVLVVALLFSASAASGHWRLWNPMHRPPLSLGEALRMATLKLKESDIVIRYCAGANANTGWKPKRAGCFWHFSFVTSDDRLIYMHVDKKGASVSLEGPTTWLEKPATNVRRKNLDEIKRLIEELIAERAVPVTVESDADCLTVQFRPRKFMIHTLQEDGEYSDQPKTFTGPDLGGFCLRICSTELVDWRSSYAWSTSSDNSYYWRSGRRTVYLTGAGKYMAVEWRVDRDAPWSFFDVRNRGGGFGSSVAVELEDVLEPNIVLLGRASKWRTNVQPSIPLADALERAEVALGMEAKRRYCTHFVLEGDPRSDRRFGKWNLLYPAEDGSQKLVVVRMDGRVTVDDWKRVDDLKYFVDTGPRYIAVSNDMEVVKRRLERLLAKEAPGAQVVIKGDTLIASRNVRSYRIHPRPEDDRPAVFAEEHPPSGRQPPFAETLVDCVGPRSNGFWLRITYDNRWASIGPPQELAEYYWDVRRGLIPTAKPKPKPGFILEPPPPSLIYELRSGRQVSRDFCHQLFMALVK
jgi:hypothetical protein